MDGSASGLVLALSESTFIDLMTRYHGSVGTTRSASRPGSAPFAQEDS